VVKILFKIFLTLIVIRVRINIKRLVANGDSWSYKTYNSSQIATTNKPTPSFIQAATPSYRPTVSKQKREKVSRSTEQGRSDGGYIGIYTPKISLPLKNFMWLFFSCDPKQIRYDICSRVGHHKF